MTMLEDWAAYCARYQYDFDFYCKGADAVTEDPDYYAGVGFDGLARDLRGYKAPEPNPTDFEWNPETKKLEFRKRF